VTGSGFTVTTTVVVPVHAPDVPVTVYVVVEGGLAVTDVPVVALSPVAGDHAYVTAPLAVNVPAVPAQVVIGGTLNTGSGVTVTVATAVPVQPSTLVPVTV
jgi:hypothetical protein